MKSMFDCTHATSDLHINLNSGRSNLKNHQTIENSMSFHRRNASQSESILIRIFLSQLITMFFRKRNSIYMAASGPRPCSRTSGPEMIQSAAFYHTLPVVWVLLDPDSCVTPPPSNECAVFWMSRNIPEICLSDFLCCLQRVPFESKSNIKNVLTHSKLYSKFNFQIVVLAFKQYVWKVIWLLPRKICSGAMFHILDLQKYPTKCTVATWTQISVNSAQIL